MEPRAPFVAGLALASVAVACNALLGVSPPPDEQDAGADALAPPFEAASPPGADADARDASARVDGDASPPAADTGASDTGATRDAGDASDSAPPPYWSFADDFELGDFRLWTKKGQSNNGTLAIVDAGAYSGCCALRATVDGTGTGFQYAIVSWPEASPSAPALTSGTIAVRARIKATQLDADTRELSIAQGGTSPDAYASAGLGASMGGPDFAWGFILTNPANANFTRQSASVVPDALGGWHCVEYVLNVATAGHIEVFMDDQAVPRIQGDTDTTVNVGWDSVTVGLGYASGAAPSDVLIDDVKIGLYADLVDKPHIGCK